ncbi:MULTISPECIES: hypothetical protein [unclassified Devosia]|uniref:hypothetical protein n=1 Tax=unclassified Devosia TaxID=196773 RepID=UPI001AC48C48|nr:MULTISPECIES: hypothetical protein [unclassified Devosia]MBN9307223.1 hypothetical protein [Devosia sp.]
MPISPKRAPRRTIKPGTRVRVLLTKPEAEMLSISSNAPPWEVDDTGQFAVVVGGVVAWAEAPLRLVDIAVGGQVLHLRWNRILAERPRVSRWSDGEDA